MNIHKNARLTPLRREEMARLVTSGQMSKAQAGRHFGVSIKTVSRWVSRYGQDGFAAMIDRSSRPHHSPRRIALSAFRDAARKPMNLVQTIAEIEALSVSCDTGFGVFCALTALKSSPDATRHRAAVFSLSDAKNPSIQTVSS